MRKKISLYFTGMSKCRLASDKVDTAASIGADVWRKLIGGTLRIPDECLRPVTLVSKS